MKNVTSEILAHYSRIAQRGMNTALKADATELQVEARKDKLNELVGKCIAPHVDRRFAEAQFEGSPTDETPFVIHTTKIFPSGKAHCTCHGSKYRSGVQCFERPCAHITALSKVAYYCVKAQG